MYDIITKKKEGQEISKEEIEFFVRGFTAGEIPDYQAAALLMAVCLRGLSSEETAHLTKVMAGSGERIDLSGLPGRKVDKHSTGGVGDKTTLVLLPLVAAAGLTVVKMAGRGLGHTGGTIDKLESIPGFRTSLKPSEFLEQARRVGAVIATQTAELTPADQKLYSLRNATATVDSLPLIASSVMSKKIATGADAVVLDVKAGSGAFMKSVHEAFDLARLMVEIGERAGLKTFALVTNMDQPLGRAVGNALEVKEAVLTLKGQGPADLLELTLALGSLMLLAGELAGSLEEGREILAGLLQSGRALEKFKEIVLAQGGDIRFIEDEEILPHAPCQENLISAASGYIWSVDAGKVGRAAVLLGAGREKKDENVDAAVGIVLRKKVGEPVDAGEVLAEMHASKEDKLLNAGVVLHGAFVIREQKPPAFPLIHGAVP